MYYGHNFSFQIWRTRIIIPYNGLISLGQIFTKRWIFALEGNFAS